MRACKTHKVYLIVVLLFGLFAAPASAQIRPAVFAYLNVPLGVGVDDQSNVFVVSDRFFALLLTRFAPNGTVTGEVSFSGLDSAVTLGTMAFDSELGVFWNLWPNGQVAFINSQNGQISPAMDIRQLNIDTSSVYDIETGMIRNFGDLIIPKNSFYGDIAVLRRGEQIDVLVSALSVSVPFVMRIRIVGDQVISAKALVSSLSTTAPNSNEPRGVAISPNGTVLTALPRQGLGLVIYDKAVTFSVDFPEKPDAASLPRVRFTGSPDFVGGEVDFTGNGMTSDSQGNFYVATGTLGSSLCGGSGELMIINPSFSRLNCSQIGGVLTNSRDVAVDERLGVAYMTLSTGTVVRFDLDLEAIREKFVFLPIVQR